MSSSTPKAQLASLLGIFVVWKGLILLIVFSSHGVGYDTSASISAGDALGSLVYDSPNHFPSPWLKFVRWDAIYFTHMAQHGHIFEQEWAWGVGHSSTLSFFTKRFITLLGRDRITSAVITGVLLSHITHWLATVQLWFLARRLVDLGKNPNSLVPFRAAALYIMSPAGVFLSAPYSESLFAFLSISGFLGYLHAVHHFNHARVFSGSALMVAAGALFGLATMIRGNGILAGVTYLIEAAATGFALLIQDFTLSRLVRLSATVVGGVLIGVGMIVPQSMAFTEYCVGRSPSDRRPWCDNVIPSIFTWVQSHYWNVGPFRYWTLSNVPLFLLAAPTLWLLTISAIDFMRNPRQFSSTSAKISSETILFRDTITTFGLALPQLALAVLALISYHVQIITRLASGYPLWYVWLAQQTLKGDAHTSATIRWMVIYALIQAGLYASFLPPA